MPQIRYVRLGGRPVNPFMQIAGIIVGVIVLGVAVVIGGFVLAALIGLGLIAWLVIFLRAWWLTRRDGGRGASQQGGAQKGGPHKGETIVEAEYRVIETRSTEEP